MGVLRRIEQHHSLSGTTLLTMTTEDGIVMAADDLYYVGKSGTAIPRANHIQKVFVLGQNILVGACGVGFHPGIEYDAEKWIPEFITVHSGDAIHRPDDVAASLETKLRDTLQRLESMPEDGLWQSHKTGDRVVTYVVAGYADSFRRPYIYEVWAEIGPEPNRLRYFSSRMNGTQLFAHGEDSFWQRSNSEEPYYSLRRKIYGEVDAAFDDGGMPANLRDALLSVVSLIKIEAQFNDKKVGQNVASAVIDRRTKIAKMFAF